MSGQVRAPSPTQRPAESYKNCTFALNEQVAVDVGARLNTYFNKNWNTNVVHIPLGYFGIDAFFN